MVDDVSDGLDVKMNYTNAQYHEPRAERNIITVKYNYRLALQRTDYATITIVMIR